MASQSFLIVEVHTAPSLQGLAVARFLRSQNLKSRACVLDGQRRELFKGAFKNNIINLRCLTWLLLSY